MVAYHFLLQELTAVDFETVSSYWVVKSVDFFHEVIHKNEGDTFETRSRLVVLVLSYYIVLFVYFLLCGPPP